MADETTTPTPESVPQDLPDTANMHEAAALMERLEEADAGRPPRPSPDPDNAQPEGNVVEPDDGVADDVELPPDDEQPAEEDASGLIDAPSFWSAEDKAAWQTVPPQLRPLIHKYEQQRNEYTKGKEQEAARIRHEAVEYAKQATGVVEEAAKWWQANGPQFFRAFGDRWATVDWNTLAEQNPAEWARLKQQREVEADMLQQAHARGQRDIETANQQSNARLQEMKRSEHEKLAAKLPQYFGPTRAAKTYDELGKFLFEQGIDAARINAIHEAPIIELALDAMRYRQAKNRASTVALGAGDRTLAAANNPGARTPLRVAPGPAPRVANQGGERQRQASERIRKGGSVNVNEAAALMSSLKL